MTFAQEQAKTWTAIRKSWEVTPHETVCGPGSTYDQTEPLRARLPLLFRAHGIHSVLDAPCGDWNWMQHVDLDGIDYTGWDVEPTLIERNQTNWPQHTFTIKSLLSVRKLPAVDLIICRDFLIHLPNDYIKAVLDKFQGSGSRFLLTTNHPGADNNVDLPPEGQEGFTAYWQRLVNVEAEPFNLKGRIFSFDEPGHPVCPNGQEMVLIDLHA